MPVRLCGSADYITPRRTNLVRVAWRPRRTLKFWHHLFDIKHQTSQIKHSQVIPLNRKQFPSSKADLAEALEETAHRFVPKDGRIVELRARVFPYIDEIAVNADGAKFDTAPPSGPRIQGETVPVFEAAAMTISANGIFIRGLPLNFRVEAHDLTLSRGQDESGNAMLGFEKLRDGALAISVAQLGLENAIGKIVRERARGLTIDQVRLAMRARGPRSIAINVQIQARKLFLRARIDISGQIDIDENLLIKISNLRCKSDGAIGSIACTSLEPIFRRIENESLSLTSLPLGRIQVRDVRVAVADTVEITADLGTAPT